MLLTNSTPVFSLITSDLIYLSFVLKLTQNVWFDVFEKWNLLWYLQNLATKRSHVSFLFRGHRFSQTSLTVGDFVFFRYKTHPKRFLPLPSPLEIFVSTQFNYCLFTSLLWYLNQSVEHKYLLAEKYLSRKLFLMLFLQ